MLEELLEAIRELTAAIRDAIPAGAEAAPAEQEEKPTRSRSRRKAAPAEDEVSLEDVRDSLKVLIDAGQNDVVKKLLKKYKAGKLSDVDAGDYATLKAEAEAAAAEGGDDDLL
jgi:hypothetical protein